MTVSSLQITYEPATDSTADVVVIGTKPAPKREYDVAVEDAGAARLHAPAAYDSLSDALTGIGVTGGADELVRIPAPVGTSRSLALVGIGNDVGPDALRYAAGSAIRQLHGVESVAIALPVTRLDELEALLEGAALGSYSFTEYRGTGAVVKTPPKTITVHVDAGLADDVARERALRRAQVTATAVARVKDLVNTPAIDLFPASLAAHAQEAAASLPIEVTVWDEAALETDGFGGILGVGQGSSRGPRLVKVSYRPEDAVRHLALVGKGITFDTGGLSLKPAASMLGMKYDMTGAASVLAVVVAAAELALPVRLTAWMCIAENMPSGTALRPGDIVRIRGGKTVEITNTDAEGRIVMADGLVAASEEQPDAIIDIATLTGAASVALGRRFAGLMGDDALVADVEAAATRAGESVWHMPMPQELRALLRSDVADLMNAKVGNTAGGMLLAAHFLREFVGERADGTGSIPWAHLDIAGPANNPESPYGFTGRGPSGVGVRALLALAEEFATR